MRSRILFINRKQKRGRKSIEKVFEFILESFDKSKYVVKEISFRTWFSALQYQSIHLTGDIYWFSLFLFWKNISLTYHDIGHYKKLSGLKRHIYFYFWIAFPVIISKKISVVSYVTRNDIKNILQNHVLLKKMVNKIHTIPNPITIRDNKNHSKSGSYLLVVGTRPNKRLDLCIKVAAKTNREMVIVGDLSDTDIILLRQRNVKYSNYVDVQDSQLCTLYQSAFCLLFLSDHEGFGLPIIESQYLGTPVICNDINILRDTGGEGALYVDNRDISEITRKIIQLNDERFRKHLINLGISNALRYDPIVVSNKYLDFFDS